MASTTYHINPMFTTITYQVIRPQQLFNPLHCHHMFNFNHPGNHRVSLLCLPTHSTTHKSKGITSQKSTIPSGSLPNPGPQTQWLPHSMSYILWNIPVTFVFPNKTRRIHSTTSQCILGLAVHILLTTCERSSLILSIVEFRQLTIVACGVWDNCYTSVEVQHDNLLKIYICNKWGTYRIFQLHIEVPWCFLEITSSSHSKHACNLHFLSFNPWSCL